MRTPCPPYTRQHLGIGPGLESSLDGPGWYVLDHVTFRPGVTGAEVELQSFFETGAIELFAVKPHVHWPPWITYDWLRFGQPDADYFATGRVSSFAWDPLRKQIFASQVYVENPAADPEDYTFASRLFSVGEFFDRDFAVLQEPFDTRRITHLVRINVDYNLPLSIDQFRPRLVCVAQDMTDGTGAEEGEIFSVDMTGADREQIAVIPRSQSLDSYGDVRETVVGIDQGDFNVLCVVVLVSEVVGTAPVAVRTHWEVRNYYRELVEPYRWLRHGSGYIGEDLDFAGFYETLGQPTWDEDLGGHFIPWQRFDFSISGVYGDNFRTEIGVRYVPLLAINGRGYDGISLPNPTVSVNDDDFPDWVQPATFPVRAWRNRKDKRVYVAVGGGEHSSAASPEFDVDEYRDHCGIWSYPVILDAGSSYYVIPADADRTLVFPNVERDHGLAWAVYPMQFLLGPGPLADVGRINDESG